MSTLLVRVTGAVLSVPEPRRGHSTRTGEAYEIATVNVLVANQNVTTCQLPRKNDFNEYDSLKNNKTGFKPGDYIDVLAEVSAYQGNPQARIIGDFPIEANVTEFLAELTSAKA